MFDFLKNMLRPSNEGEIKKVRKIVDQINALEPQIQKLSDEEMRAQIAGLRQRAQGGESLDALLPQTYALVREAGVRVLNQRAFDNKAALTLAEAGKNSPHKINAPVTTD